MRRTMVNKQSLLKLIDDQKIKNQEIMDQVIKYQAFLVKEHLPSQNSDELAIFNSSLKKSDILI
jgi:hypothetical protein